MNLMYVANIAILSVFMTLFALDVGIAILLLTPFRKQRASWIYYLTPIWELEGTFAVFYVVNLVATYPTALPLLANLYVFPAIMAGLFLLVGNAFLAYSEYSKEGTEKYLKIYSAATIIVAFLFAGIFGSALSGMGINAANGTASIFGMLFNPFSVILFFIIALAGTGMTGVVFRVKGMKYWSLAMIVGSIAIGFGILAAYTPYLPSGAFQIMLFAVLPILVLAAVCVLRIKEKRAAGPLAIFGIALAVNLLGMLQYPYLFGGKATLLNYLNNTAIASAINFVTVVFGSILAVALVYFIYISYIKK